MTNKLFAIKHPDQKPVELISKNIRSEWSSVAVWTYLIMNLTHFYPPLRFRNQVPTFAVRETNVSRHNGGTSGAPHKPLRDDSALRALSMRGLRGAPEVPPLCRETQSLGQRMLERWEKMVNEVWLVIDETMRSGWLRHE